MTLARPKYTIAKVLLVLIVIVTFIRQGWVIFQESTPVISLIDNIIAATISLFTAAMCSYIARQNTFTQKAWYFFAAAFTAFFLGDIIWIILEFTLQKDPFPSVADIFYLAVVPLCGFGLLSFPKKPVQQHEITRVLLNVLLMLGAIGTFLWHFLFSQIVQNTQPDVGFLVSFAYIIADITVLAIVFFTFFRSGGQQYRTEFLWIGAGFLFNIIADLGFSFSSAYDIEAQIMFLNGGWSWFAVCISTAAYFNLHRSQKVIDLTNQPLVLNSVFVMSAPLLASFATAIIYVFSSPDNVLQHTGTGIGFLIVLVMVMLRQTAMFIENKTLNEDLLRFSDDLEQRVQQRTQQLEWAATHDALTGLSNRVRLQQHLSTVLQEGTVAVMFIDLDGFKRINDTLGHLIGDELLREVAFRLRGSIPIDGLVCRTGGDEFVVVLPSHEDAQTHATYLLKQLEKPFLVLELEFALTASIGVSISPKDGNDAETLQRHADAAMYTAKHLGQGKIEFFTQAIRDQLERRLEIEQHLRGAISSHEFSLHFQPIVQTTTRQLQSFEALIRWNSVALGKVAPAEFIHVAEESGLIGSITNWVIDTALTQQRQWLEAGYAIVPIAVNVPMAQIAQPDFFVFVQQSLEKHGLPAQYLHLELLEDALAQPHVADALRQFRILGVKISIDDFGTGYSNLSYLHNLPIDTLKIAQVFIANANHINSEALLKTIIAIGETLGLHVIAEGVETAQQLEQLQRLSCDAIQGYVFAAPAESSAAKTWLEQPLFKFQREVNGKIA